MRAYFSVAHLKLMLSELSACIWPLLLISFPENQESDTKQHWGIYSHYRNNRIHRIQEVQFSPCIKHPSVNHHHRLPIVPCKDTQSVVWDVKEKISRTSVYGEKKKPKLIQKILKTYPLPSTFLSFHLFNWVIALSLFSPFPCTHSPRSSCYILSPISISQLFFKNFQKKMQLSPCDTRRRVNTQTNEEKKSSIHKNMLYLNS